MTNYPWSSLDEIADADASTRVANRIESGDVDDFEDVRELLRYRCRDNARTPMQWSDAERAGFTDGDPWLPVNPNHDRINVADARDDPDSVWHYYRELIDLRHDSDLLVYGDYHLLTDEHPQVWAYTRQSGDRRALVVLNWSDETATYDPSDDLPGNVVADADPTLLLSNAAAGAAVSGEDPSASANADAFGELALGPYEARVYELS
jgi:oligo-1,6-glucosidase